MQVEKMVSKEESSMSKNNRLKYFRLGCQGRLEGLTYNLRPETCKGGSLSFFLVLFCWIFKKITFS